MALLLAILFVNLRGAASAPLAHLLLHLFQALVQQVPLQQTGQLVLGKVSRTLKKMNQEEPVLTKGKMG